MSKKWPFKKSPGAVVTALIEDVEDLQDTVHFQSRRIALLEKHLDETDRYCATHRHTSYPANVSEDDLRVDIGPFQ